MRRLAKLIPSGIDPDPFKRKDTIPRISAMFGFPAKICLELILSFFPGRDLLLINVAERLS